MLAADDQEFANSRTVINDDDYAIYARTASGCGILGRIARVSGPHCERIQNRSVRCAVQWPCDVQRSIDFDPGLYRDSVGSL